MSLYAKASLKSIERQSCTRRRLTFHLKLYAALPFATWFSQNKANNRAVCAFAIDIRFCAVTTTGMTGPGASDEHAAFDGLISREDSKKDTDGCHGVEIRRRKDWRIQRRI